MIRHALRRKLFPLLTRSSISFLAFKQWLSKQGLRLALHLCRGPFKIWLIIFAPRPAIILLCVYILYGFYRFLSYV